MQTNRTNTLYATWYSIGVLLLIFQAVSTVYQLSTTISDGQKIAKLQRDHQELTNQKTTSEQLATSLVAISQIKEQLPAGFGAVTKPLIVRTSDSVASR